MGKQGVKLKFPSKRFKKKRAFIFLIVAGILCTALLIFYFCLPDKLVCGDDTDYDACSVNQPYFCEEGFLIERASVCGCPENLTLEGESCVSGYQTEPKEISLEYILRGETGEINFTVYEGVAEYLSKLPRSISSENGEVPTKADFKLKRLNNKYQEAVLLPLVVELQNLFENEKDQVRIAVSIVQMIPFGSSDKVAKIGGSTVDYMRYPYEVLYDGAGVCGEKAELLAYLLREMGYGVAFLYYPLENHEALAIRCPKWRSVKRTNYCFIETTGPAIITDDEIEYAEFGKLTSEPELIIISDGKSIGLGWYEFRDANIAVLSRNLIKKKSLFASLFYNKLNKLNEKYGLNGL